MIRNWDQAKGHLPTTINTGIAIGNTIRGTEDHIQTAKYKDHQLFCKATNKIYYNKSGEAFIIKDNRRYYLAEFIKIQH